MAKLPKWTTDQWLPRMKDGRREGDGQEYRSEDFCWDPIIRHLHWGGRYINHTHDKMTQNYKYTL